MFDKYANKGRHVAIIDFNHVLHRFHIAMGRLGLSSGVSAGGYIKINVCHDYEELELPLDSIKKTEK